MRLGWIGFIGCLLLASGASAQELSRVAMGNGSVKVAHAAPTFAGWNLDGEQVSSRRLWGSAQSPGQGPVVVSFFATWCEPCKRGLPAIQRLARLKSDKGVSVVLVAFQQSADEIKAWLAEQKIALPTLPDPHGKVSARYGVDTALPRTFVIDATGVVRTIFVEEGKDFERMLSLALDAAAANTLDVKSAVAP